MDDVFVTCSESRWPFFKAIHTVVSTQTTDCSLSLLSGPSRLYKNLSLYEALPPEWVGFWTVRQNKTSLRSTECVLESKTCVSRHQGRASPALVWTLDYTQHSYSSRATPPPCTLSISSCRWTDKSDMVPVYITKNINLNISHICSIYTWKSQGCTKKKTGCLMIGEGKHN